MSDNNWIYTTKNQAKEVLNFYEDFLLKCSYITYIAIVWREEFRNFELEIGIMESGKNIVKINDRITPVQAYFGKFNENDIPQELPVPTDFFYRVEDYIKNGDMGIIDLGAMFLEKETIPFNIKSIPIKREFVIADFKINDSRNETKAKKNTKQNKNVIKNSCFLKKKDKGFGIESVYGKEGSLGGAFRLLQFPDKLFGITNDHIFSKLQARPGTNVIDQKCDELIGKLFWRSFDRDKEVAFIQFEKTFANKILEGKTNIDFEWQIIDPIQGMVVTHNGVESNPTPKREGLIHSLNATVRVYYNHFNGRRVFKNQILIESVTVNPDTKEVLPFTTYGDSGALIFEKNSDNKNAIGLNFTLSSRNAKYTVANNINNIFNKAFSQKQEVLATWEPAKEASYTINLSNNFKLNN